MIPAQYSNDALCSQIRELGIVPEEQLTTLCQQSEKEKTPLGDLLVENELMTDKNVGRLVADLMHIPFVTVADTVIAPEILTCLPATFAKSSYVIPFKKDDKGVHVASASPDDPMLRSFVEKKIQLPVIWYYATKRDLIKGQLVYAQDVKGTFESLLKKGDDVPVIQIVDSILKNAYQNKTSDIHIEPHSEQALVRYRIDGILHDVLNIPLSVHPKVVTRIKVMSRLRTDEHQAPQDGKLTFDAEGEEVDVRVSIVPVTTGEKIVMRLLAAKSRRISLSDLGFSHGDLEKVKASYRKPYGMILATGPTGSGKTTSMYAILKLLNRREVNIMTIEDPVEYQIEGVSQIQVNPKTNLTFAEGLRSIVRQDPNIILVGEIRDQETASIAVNAAMTGHLVLSTLHTNDAATAVPRLMDMGIEPFLVASSVNVIVAQRLVRNIHTTCRVSEEVSIEQVSSHFHVPLVQKVFGDKKNIRLYHGKGCSLCHGTGYQGRIGIYEVLLVDDEIRQAIVERKTSAFISSIAVKNGMLTMVEDALIKVREGMTTLQEVMRVTKE